MRSVKHGRKKSVRYRYNISSAKRQNKKLKKLRKFKGCQPIENAWQKQMTTRQNLASMGLAYDPNEAMEVDGDVKHLKTGRLKKSAKCSTTNVLLELEQIAIDETSESDKQKKRQRQKATLHPNDTDICKKLLSKHGENYEAMARDSLNIWQDTPRQLERKIGIYKKNLNVENI
uniref:Nucleolar protein 16 n=1 Tax=Meloidogyne incognita TaxID=6306 RepID=A0A914KTP9_MELIC